MIIPTIDMSNYVILSLPAFSALICLVMCLYSDKESRSWKDREIGISLTGYFLTVFFNWIMIAIFLYTSRYQAFFYPLRYSSLLLTQVFFYRFIYTLTRLPEDKPFSLWHYIVPILLGVVSAIWSMLTPDWVLDKIVESVAQPVNEYPLFSRFIVSFFKMRLVYDIIYTILSLRRIRRYRHEVENYASQLQQSYMGWLNVLIILVIVLIIGPAFAAFSSDRIALATGWSFIPILFLLAQHLLIVYNTLSHNYIILEDMPEDSSTISASPERGERPNQLLSKREFERFLMEKKPFMDKDLKITDLATKLNTNRTYLSVFINTTYGVNFSSLINERRLNYLEELRIHPAMKNKTNIELIYLAGFGSYQSYLRAKQKEYRNSTLKL